jgi:hypothetical protein
MTARNVRSEKLLNGAELLQDGKTGCIVAIGLSVVFASHKQRVWNEHIEGKNSSVMEKDRS